MIHLEQPALKTIEHQVQQLPDGISFAQGALRIGGVDQAIHEHVQEILNSDKADYYVHSLGIAPLRQKLAENLSSQFNTSLSFENIMVSHGSINGLAALCLMLLDQGDEVILPEPTYAPFVNVIALAKARHVFAPAYKQIIQSDGSLRWVMDMDTIKKARTPKTKMIIIAQPSNPCGVCLTQEELNEIANWCEENSIYCIFDEAYENYFFDSPQISSTPLIAQSKFLLRTGSFSKTFGMSGWRVGYVVASREVINNCAAIQDGLICCTSAIGQHAALYALSRSDITARYTEYIRRNRDLAYELLTPLIHENIIVCPKPSAGFYFFLRTHDKNTDHLAQDLLTKKHVALVPGRGFGPSGADCMRLCYARKTEILQEGLSRLVDYFKNNQKN